MLWCFTSDKFFFSFLFLFYFILFYLFHLLGAGDSVPHGLDYCNGKNNNGLHTVPGSDSCNTGSSNGSSWAEDKMRRCCSKKVLYKRIPVFNLFQTYKKDMFMADLVAGITVGLTMIPQAIAYANVAGLPSKVRIFAKIVLSC